MRIPAFLSKYRESLFKKVDRGFRYCLDNLCISLLSYKTLFFFISGLCFLYSDNDLCGISVYEVLYFTDTNHKNKRNYSL